MISLIAFSSALFADASIGVRVQAPIGNSGVIDIGFKSDDHRYDNRYRNFDYRRNGYYDDFGYFFGYFDRVGYFYNNIFFTYDSRYTYRDRLYHKGFFSPKHVHYRPYKIHKVNNWNENRSYRNAGQPIYGKYYDKRQINNNRNESNNRFNDNKQNNKNYKNDRQENNNRYNNGKRKQSNDEQYYEREQKQRR